MDIEKGESIATCQYCGTKQTIPQYHDEQQIQKYNKINELRQNNDYEEALKLCKDTIETDTKDAETYWNTVLCKYGVEYVEDPVTHKHIPTINRMQFDSILKDNDYLAVLNIADQEQKELYETQAKEIYEIQKDTLEIIKKEKPFDVFICYKESDKNGKRTQDSVIANDLYHALTKEGFKVFFARITLEDKLGSQYEPYIFSALNSAKVMIILGTKPEYFNAVWVKNEWSRFLSLAKEDANKVLIPAYKDMDPYDLPPEFAKLQAQDMSKLAFIQDLIYGIRKILKNNKKATPINFLKKNIQWVSTIAALLVVAISVTLFFSNPQKPLLTDNESIVDLGSDEENDLDVSSDVMNSSSVGISSEAESNSSADNTQDDNNHKNDSSAELDENQSSVVSQYNYTDQVAEITTRDLSTGFVIEGRYEGSDLYCIDIPKMPIVFSGNSGYNGGKVKFQINDIKIEDTYKLVLYGKNLSDEGNASFRGFYLYNEIYENGFFSKSGYSNYTKCNANGDFRTVIFLPTVDSGESFSIFIGTGFNSEDTW